MEDTPGGEFDVDVRVAPGLSTSVPDVGRIDGHRLAGSIGGDVLLEVPEARPLVGSM